MSSREEMELGIKKAIENKNFVVISAGLGRGAGTMIEKVLKNNQTKFLREEEHQDNVLVINGKLKEVNLDSYIMENKPEYIISEVKVNDESIEKYKKLTETHNVKVIWKITDANSDSITLDSCDNFNEFSLKAKEIQQISINNQNIKNSDNLIQKIQTEKNWLNQDKSERTKVETRFKLNK